MAVIFGREAYAPFRRERLAAALAAVAPELQIAGAVFVFLTERELPEDDAAQARLRAVLLEGEPAGPDIAPNVFALPRFGTISPWSSKATEILWRCGYEAVGRIECGIAFNLKGPLPQPGTDKWRAAESALTDRMTHTLVASLDEADALFAHPAPAASRAIPLAEQGEQALIEADRVIPNIAGTRSSVRGGLWTAPGWRLLPSIAFAPVTRPLPKGS